MTQIASDLERERKREKEREKRKRRNRTPMIRETPSRKQFRS